MDLNRLVVLHNIVFSESFILPFLAYMIPLFIAFVHYMIYCYNRDMEILKELKNDREMNLKIRMKKISSGDGFENFLDKYEKCAKMKKFLKKEGIEPLCSQDLRYLDRRSRRK